MRLRGLRLDVVAVVTILQPYRGEISEIQRDTWSPFKRNPPSFWRRVPRVYIPTYYYYAVDVDPRKG